MSSDQTKKETYVLSERSPAEVKRLNWQHDYLRRCMGGPLIHTSIPMDEIACIADIGCGTGKFLEDISKDLATSAPATGIERTYYGFDISPKMFPPESERGKIKFEILDLLQPVPAEYHAKFDLINIRLLCVAIREVDLGRAVRNAEQMITEPGGYIQWVETGAKFIPDVPQYPEIDEISQKIVKFWLASGFSEDALKVLIQEAPPSIQPSIKRYNYPWNSTPELVEEAIVLFTYSYRAMIPVVLIRTQEVATPEDAAKKAEEAIEIIKTMPKELLVASGMWSAMVAQKQLA